MAFIETIQDGLCNRSEILDIDGRWQSAINEARGGDRTMVLHVEGVTEGRNTGEFSGSNAKTRVARLLYDLGRRDRLTAVHARARDDDDRSSDVQLVGRR